MTKPVVVTGLGLVTPLGVGKEAFGDRLFAGASGIVPLPPREPPLKGPGLGAPVADFRPRELIASGSLRRMDPLSRMVAAGARMALEDAGVEITPANRDRVGIVLGTAFGATDVAAQFARVLFTEGPRMANPILVPNTVMNAPAGHASIELGFRGVNSTVNHREASGETAIAYAASEVRRGRADVMLAGGAEILSDFFLEVLARFRALSPRDGGPAAARPFDRRRNGLVAGEGAGLLCLETLEHALARGAAPYCEVAGWGLSAAPAPLSDWPTDPRGPVLALTRALAAAGAAPGEVDWVSAAAHGGERLDRLEAEALATVFGPGAAGPAVSSLKGALGESFSSGGIRSAAMALALGRGVIPPTLGLAEPLADLDFVRGAPRRAPVACGLVNGLASGGTFATLVFKALPPLPEPAGTGGCNREAMP
jgi:3-oxoacyl-[acyl-carrier-protein] synthase II